ncbi:Cytochrome c domain-containing protein [Sulfidibacter corallicola]|uniref:Cytochrome c domain-containing protein n=1 Tax=Sulfidibacter corallicola TaxID=2818388 RepID=A0A8A4TE74_SULCO|nr:hypothetical protein [Sulfidibacter corallicola]QTD47933.1 hypothetical protein J3U87_20295 [Sulfidibacter corallicola]
MPSPFTGGLLLLTAVLFSCGQANPAHHPAPESFARMTNDWDQLTGDAELGRVRARQLCLGCHVIEDVGNQLSDAPTFEQAMAEAYMDPAYLRMWLWNPPAVKVGTLMPDLSLKPDEIENMVAFLARYRPQPASNDVPVDPETHETGSETPARQ